MRVSGENFRNNSQQTVCARSLPWRDDSFIFLMFLLDGWCGVERDGGREGDKGKGRKGGREGGGDEGGRRQRREFQGLDRAALTMNDVAFTIHRTQAAQ